MYFKTAKKSIHLRTFITKSEAGTESLAKAIAKEVVNSKESERMVCLYGDLGVGKTVFSKGFCKALGVDKNKIKSPTYTFVREYVGSEYKIFHFDFYRIVEGDDLVLHEVESILSQPDALFIIEWPTRIDSLLSRYPFKKVEITYLNEHEREINIS